MHFNVFANDAVIPSRPLEILDHVLQDPALGVQAAWEAERHRASPLRLSLGYRFLL